ncbi:MAG TPA: SDR family NAD(P)-dependent oxidoreductase [Acetobacteraceae bacterium]|nr:SDR family NAD(P)-dependent oxidoreductase [Acetobacteraceae bacterium]
MADRALSGSIALVTGASRGLGAAAAIELARAGAHVVIAARDDIALARTDDAIRALGGEATLLPADLTNGEVTDAIGPSLYERFGRLDILVHAAGSLGLLTPVSHIMPEQWEPAFGINVTATWRLIRTTEPLLRAAPAGRAVVLTSSQATSPHAYWGIFGASMAARQNLALTWALEVASSNLRVNLFDPVKAATGLRAQAYPGEDPSGLPHPEALAPAIAALCLPEETRHGVLVTAEAAKPG